MTAAVQGFNEWSALKVQERVDILFKLADLIDANAEDIAAIECLDMAMLMESLKLRLVPRGALNFRNYAELVAEHEERAWSSKGTQNRVIRDPAGPAVIITPVECAVYAFHLEACPGAGGR